MANKIQLNVTTKNGDTFTTIPYLVYVSDNSTRIRGVMDDNKLTLEFSLSEYVDMPEVSCTYGGEMYYSFEPPQVKKEHDRSYSYTLEVYSEAHLTHITMMRDIVLSYDESGTYTGGNKITFPLTGTPLEHLRMVVDSLNYKLGYTVGNPPEAWKVGDCIDTEHGNVLIDKGTEKCIPYDYTTLHDALNLIADEFETEWEVDSVARTINLHKVQYGMTIPLPLRYGEGNGLKSGVVRNNSNNIKLIDTLYVQGSEQNIDPQHYGLTTILYRANKYLADGTLDGSKYYNQEGDGYASKSRTLMLPYQGKIWYNGVTDEFLPYVPHTDEFRLQDIGRKAGYLYLRQYFGKNITVTELQSGGVILHGVEYQSDLPVEPGTTLNTDWLDHTGFVLYEVTPDRLAVRRVDNRLSHNGNMIEGVYDGTAIYPKRVGLVSSVDTPDVTTVESLSDLPQASAVYEHQIYKVTENDKYYTCAYNTDESTAFWEWQPLSENNAPLVDFYDNADDCPDYSECGIGGETITVIFQSGMLAGKEFDLNTYESGKLVNPYVPITGRKFEIVPKEIDGQVMPSPVNGYMPKAGDKYAIFHCKPPLEYYRRDLVQKPYKVWVQPKIMTRVGTITGTPPNNPLEFDDGSVGCPDYSQYGTVTDMLVLFLETAHPVLKNKVFQIDSYSYSEGVATFSLKRRSVSASPTVTLPDPNDIYTLPNVGDKYAILYCSLPSSYASTFETVREYSEAENREGTILIGFTQESSGLEPRKSGQSRIFGFFDSDPECPNYANCGISGETMTVLFTTGPLAGKEFVLDCYSSTGNIVNDFGTQMGYTNVRRFEIVQREYDGTLYPNLNAGGMPLVGDKYVIKHFHLAETSIKAGFVTRHDSPEWVLQGAEWDFMRAAVKFLHEHSEPSYTINSVIDKKWYKENVNNRIPIPNSDDMSMQVSDYMKPGGYVSIEDQHLPANKIFRITSIQEKINDPYDVSIVLSDSMKRTGYGTKLNKERGERIMPSGVVETKLMPYRDGIDPTQSPLGPYSTN